MNLSASRGALLRCCKPILENLESRRLLAAEGLAAIDFGDAPDTYRTTFAVNGARHDVTPNVKLGLNTDIEPDGNPSPGADRDDLTGVVDDEDGIVFLDPIVPGTTVDVQVTNGAGSGLLSAWVDFNLNGTFDAAELIFNNVALPPASVTVQSFLVPASALAGNSYSRFRLAGSGLGGVPQPFGANGVGEVEDYAVQILPPPTAAALDYGDAPDTYRTKLAVNGARHTATPNIRLGALVDSEIDGQPSISATRDDAAGVDDEDGVLFLTPIVQGGVATVQVTNGGGAGRLNAWMDFNSNGFFDPGEQIFTNVPMAGGSVNVLNFPVPAASATGTTYSRWRVNTAGGLGPVGFGGLGEVEDYQNKLDAAAPPKLDYGDAPNTYGTTLALNGARHFATPNLRLGALVDAETDGQPTVLANGDNINAANDEDGVVFVTPMQQGQIATVQVTNGAAAGRLNAWVDFNGNGVFGPGEQIFTNVPLAAISVNNLNFAVPAAATVGITYARFRLSAGAGVGATGHGGTGEVEDYQTRIEPFTPSKIDFGDAPEAAGTPFQYPTLLGGFSGNPARHTIVGGAPMLGNVIDAEVDGQPNVPATGDDLNSTDDEEGVTIGGVPLELVPLSLGSTVQIEVENGGTSNGVLNAWFDFNQNGSWSAAEQVAVDVPIAAGATILLNVNIPATLNINLGLYSRFRLSTQLGLQPTGAAQNGEVEDYRSPLKQPQPTNLLDFGDAPEVAGTPTIYPTTLAGPSGNPARHIIVTAGPRLGNRIDPEPDGQPNVTASGDDTGLLFGGIDDEDGVTVGGAPLDAVPLNAGSIMPMQVSNPTGVVGFVSAWYDWNTDGDWNDAGEQVATNLPAPPGLTIVPVAVPAGLSINGLYYSRWRVSTDLGLLPTGLAKDGEVEDYVQRVNPDTVKPFVIASRVEFEKSQSLVVEFSEDIDPSSVQPGDVKATHLGDGSVRPAASVEWELGNTIARFTFNSAGFIMPDGNYEFDMADMSDSSGNTLLPATYGGPDSFWLAADANRSRRVSLDDFTALAANFGLPGRTFSQGNFNYDDSVNLDDFTILASQFGTGLAPAALPRAIGLSGNDSGGVFDRQGIAGELFAEEPIL